MGFLFAEKTTDFYFFFPFFPSFLSRLSASPYLSLSLSLFALPRHVLLATSSRPSFAKLFDVLRLSTPYFLSPRFFHRGPGKLLTYFIFRTDVSRPCSRHCRINRALVLLAARTTLFLIYRRTSLVVSISSSYSLFSRTRCLHFLLNSPESRAMILYDPCRQQLNQYKN